MFLFKLFCDTQEMHKLLIRESWNDCKYLIDKFSSDRPTFAGSIVVDDYNNLSNEEREEFIEYKLKLEELINIVIHNLICYCANYPNEKISKHRFIREYKEYSYRLEQNINKVLLEL